MFTLVVDYEDGKRDVFENLTTKEFGKMLVEMSEKYYMPTDRAMSQDGFCTIYVTAINRNKVG